MAPYAQGVEGLRIRLGDENQTVVEVRVPRMDDAELRALARRNGGILTFVIVLRDGSSVSSTSMLNSIKING